MSRNKRSYKYPASPITNIKLISELINSNQTIVVTDASIARTHNNNIKKNMPSILANKVVGPIMRSQNPKLG